MTRAAPLLALADSVADEAEMYAWGLEYYGFRVAPIVTGDPADAASRIRRLHPDVVLTRLLPGQFGVHLIRLLRSADASAATPILVITSLTRSDMHQQARDAGAADILVLPKTPEQIAAIVRAYL